MADVLSQLRQWSGSASSNKPADTDVIGSGLADNIRTVQSVIRTYLASQSATVVPSAGVADLSTATGHWVPVSGNSTITGFGTEAAGIEYVVNFTGTPPLIHNSTSFILPGSATVVPDAGAVCVAESLGSGNWKLWGFSRASGAPANMSQITNSISVDVNLNNTGSFFDGPSIAQGTSGTWFVSGKVTVTDSSSAALIAKLWDGTTVVDAGAFQVAGNGFATITLSGIISSPAANLKISVKDSSNTTGKIVANQSGTSKDSTISAIRIA